MNENMPTDINNKEKDFQKKVKQENKSNLVKKGALGVMLGVSTIASSMESGESTKEFKTLESTDSIETTIEETAKSTEDIANPFNIEPDKDGLYENTDSMESNLETDPPKEEVKTDPEKKSEFEEVKETISIIEGGVADITTFFPESDASLTPEGIEKVQEILRALFDGATQEQIDGLIEGTMKVVAYCESSQTEVREGGSPQKDGSILMNNYEFSLKRGNNTFDVSDSVFAEYDIPDAEREIDIAQEDGYELGTTSKNTREVKISIELIEVIVEELDENTNFSNTAFVIIDQSPSMRSEADLVKNAVEKYNQDFEGDVKVINLEAGKTKTVEDHLGTLTDLLDSIEKPYANPQEIHMYTDEKQNKRYLDFENKMQEQIDKAQALNMTIILHAYQAGNTGEEIVKVLDADDLIGRKLGNKDALASK